jgi:hypothetical protein
VGRLGRKDVSWEWHEYRPLWRRRKNTRVEGVQAAVCGCCGGASRHGTGRSERSPRASSRQQHQHSRDLESSGGGEWTSRLQVNRESMQSRWEEGFPRGEEEEEGAVEACSLGWRLAGLGQLRPRWDCDMLTASTSKHMPRSCGCAPGVARRRPLRCNSAFPRHLPRARTTRWRSDKHGQAGIPAPA